MGRLQQWLLQFLMAPRGANCRRRPLILPSEALALLVKGGAMTAADALSSASIFLDAPERRCAGLTMLGKLIEQAIETMQVQQMLCVCALVRARARG